MFDIISANPGAKFFMRTTVTLRKKKHNNVRVFFDPFSSRIALHHNFTMKNLYSIEFFNAFK